MDPVSNQLSFSPTRAQAISKIDSAEGYADQAGISIPYAYLVFNGTVDHHAKQGNIQTDGHTSWTFHQLHNIVACSITVTVNFTDLVSCTLYEPSGYFGVYIYLHTSAHCCLVLLSWTVHDL